MNATRAFPLLLCAAGLLLSIVEVPGFGIDFANDTVGYVLVCLGAARCPLGARRQWCRLTTITAGASALVALFSFGGPAGSLVPYMFLVWDVLLNVEMLLSAVVVAGVLLMLASVATGSWVATLPWAAVVTIVLGAAQVMLYVTGYAYAEPWFYLRQLLAVLLGLLGCLTVIAAFVVAAAES